MRATKSAADLILAGNTTPNVSNNGRRKSNMQMMADSRKESAVRMLEETVRRNSRCQVQLQQHVLLSGMHKVEFGHATGEHGLEWEDMIVTRVTGQARRKQVQVGWKIYMVDGKAVSSGEEIFLRLQDAKWQWRSCNVWFVTDMAAIKAEQARDRLHKIQAEAERLARLPFEGVNDATHMEQVTAEFHHQGTIDRADERAITLAQLRRVIKWTDDHCHRWRDPVSKLKLQVETMTMQQMNHWLLKPATQEKGCSFVELLTSQKQSPSWFVICSFADQIEGFARCLELHSSTRKLKEGSAFWIAAFAYRQHTHGLDQEIGEDPKRSSFFRAMAAADFHVLMTLDVKVTNNNTLLTPFTRIWCDYEALQVVEQSHAVFDVAAVQENKVSLITLGLTAEEQDMEQVNPGSGYKAKSEREKAFSQDVIDYALKIHMQRAEATDFNHRVRILNQLAKRDPTLAPLEDHDSYSRANKRLQALFALTCWRRIMTAAAEAQSEMQKLQEKLADAIRNDTWRESLDLSLAFTPMNVEKLALLGRSLPPSLRELKLDMKMMNIGDDSMATLAGSLPSNLESLRLDLSMNQDITNYGVTVFADKVPPKLHKQSLGLKSTSVTKEFQDQSDTLDGIKKCILAEQMKGSICHTVNLTPIQDRHRKGMNYSHELSKV